MDRKLTRSQTKILNIFYNFPATKVVCDKKQRAELWKQTTAKSLAMDLSVIESKCPALSHQIRRSYGNGKNIQSAVFSECAYAQTLANMLSLTIFINYAENNVSLPPLVRKTITENSLAPRYIYTNVNRTIFLIQAGGHGGIDCALASVDDGAVYTIEFKEPGAKTSEPDLPKYGEDGNLLITPEFLEKYPQFREMLNDQKELNFFSAMGNNVHDFRDESINMAVSNNYLKKFADVICTEDTDGFLVMIPAGQVGIWAELEGEIRPAGRNHYNVWTPNALNEFLKEKGATVSAGIVTIEIDKLEVRTERGGNGKISGYKINPLFFVYLKDCSIDNDKVGFEIKSVQQLNPTIAGKMFFKNIKHDDVKRYYIG